ncbi:MAG: Spy/CpxP family protein refolding chaperone [Verrucomicrobiota bacterium]
MKTKFLILALAAAVLAGGLIATKTFAADQQASGSMREKIRQRIAEKLGLTDGQKSQIKAVYAGEKDALKPLLTQLHEARVGLRAAIRATDANEAAVRTTSAKVAAAEADLAVERMKLAAKINPILNDEQRRKIGEMEQKVDDFMDKSIAHLGEAAAN